MSLYHETAEILLMNSGSLRSRVFGKKNLKSQPAQVFALAMESCKWNIILKEVIENADFLRLERKVTPVLSILLVHDLLLAKRGIALPATHGLRTAIERYKARLLAEFTKARIRRKLPSLEAFKEHIEAGLERREDATIKPYPRWVRINTLKTTLKDEIEKSFSDYQQVTALEDVRKTGSKLLCIDKNIPNLIALSPSIEISRSVAYKSGAIIFQDKSSCFPAYLLNPLPADGDMIDACSAPGNKTTHLAAILQSLSSEKVSLFQSIHAFEKNKQRAEIMDKMVKLAGASHRIKFNSGEDFLNTNPCSSDFDHVGALLLDPSCSGSGIIDREEMPYLHVPLISKCSLSDGLKQKKRCVKTIPAKIKNQKRKFEETEDINFLVDDEGEITALESSRELEARLNALSSFQVKLLLHAFKFPAARKITYSTCSIYAQENELVVIKALEDPDVKKRGWRILKREEQVSGMRDWPVRGSREACGEHESLAEACIRTNKGDDHATMGFFVAAFVRDQIK
ncbi:25S rRNA -methyltransferase rcm1 [Golovinomyces cichoracearum]|uniref:25S rRNA-methyltransferase rcm1 n=1 Tax=Golovinomyces cichoracearum TaxID=62708 RepID=A0A420I3M1_9PEZI|nr:25S rRNA -methyltransferase rcm1 [Golovinomyces cichoracearum]